MRNGRHRTIECASYMGIYGCPEAERVKVLRLYKILAFGAVAISNYRRQLSAQRELTQLSADVIRDSLYTGYYVLAPDLGLRLGSCAYTTTI